MTEIAIDLTMALVERDFGIRVALEVARELVGFSSVPAVNPSSQCSQVRWLARTAHSKPYLPGSPTTLAP